MVRTSRCCLGALLLTDGWPDPDDLQVHSAAGNSFPASMLRTQIPHLSNSSISYRLVPGRVQRSLPTCAIMQTVSVHIAIFKRAFDQAGHVFSRWLKVMRTAAFHPRGPGADKLVTPPCTNADDIRVQYAARRIISDYLKWLEYLK
jgi:hypothetical protein